MKIQVFWDMTPCRLVSSYRRFRWAFFNSRSWLLGSWLYCQQVTPKRRQLLLRRSFGKYRTFCHTKIFIDNRNETEYAGFITHLHLLLHIVTLHIEALVVPWHQFTYSLLVPDGRGTQRAQILRYCKCSVTISYTTVRDTSGHCSYTSLIVKCRFSRMMRFNFCFNAFVMTEGRPDLSASWTSVRQFLNIVHIFGHWPRSLTCLP